MTNIIKSLSASMIEDRGTNKSFPCKTYATEDAAEKATAVAAQNVANHFLRDQTGDARCAGYLVFYVADFGRWVGAINLTEVMGRKESTGGYLGVEPGFYKF